MAKLNSSLQFAAAVTAISIGTGKRLMRNFHYYRQNHAGAASRDECVALLRDIRFDLFSLQNLYLDAEQSTANSSFKVMLAKQVQDRFEELHRKILFYNADFIADLIPILDKQRSFWKKSSEPEFYDEDLPALIDRHLTSDFPAMEHHLHSLPAHSDSVT